MFIKGADRRGLLYGLATAFQLLAVEEGAVPSGTIEDAPLYPFRSFQLDLARQPETVATIKKWIVRSAIFKMNRLGLYLEDAFTYRACPGVAPEGALDAASYREIDRYGRAWGVEVYPMMNCYGHMENFLRDKKLSRLSEGRDKKNAKSWLGDASGTICAELPEARAFLRDQIQEWGELSTSPFLHVGMDECFNFASCPLCFEKARRYGAGKVFLDHLLFLRETAASVGKTIGIWDDIVYWIPEIVKEIPKDVVLFDWNYSHITSPRRYCELNHMATDPGRWLVDQEGFSMVACPATNLENIHSYRSYCDSHAIKGFHVTTWELSHKFLEECVNGYVFGAEAAWARSPVSIEVYPERLAAAWYGTRDERVAAAAAGALPNYSDHGNDRRAPASLIRHELSAEAFEASRSLRRLLTLADSGKEAVIRNHFTYKAMRLNFARTHYSIRLDMLVNEVAVAMRQALRAGAASHLVSRVADRLADLKILQAELTSNIEEFGKLWKAEPKSIPRRHGVNAFDDVRNSLDEFIQAVETFVADPKAPTELGKFWVAIDFAEIDINYRRVHVEGSEDGKSWKLLLATKDCAENAYREAALLPVAKPPRFLRLTVSRIGASAIQNVRIIGWRGEWFPVRIAATEGTVLTPEHLLRDDSRAAIVGEPDAWRFFHRSGKAERHAITLEMAPYVPYPEQLHRK